MGYYFSPFRKEYHELIHKKGGPRECPFCSVDNIEHQAVRDMQGKAIENTHSRWMINLYPYCNAHTLVVPKRHISDIHDFSPEELQAHHDLIAFAADALQKLYPEAGIEIFLQYGKGSRMSIPHLHHHVVPALPGDQFRGLEKHEFFECLEEGKEKVIMLPAEVTLARGDLQKALAEVIGTYTVA